MNPLGPSIFELSWFSRLWEHVLSSAPLPSHVHVSLCHPPLVHSFFHYAWRQCTNIMAQDPDTLMSMSLTFSIEGMTPSQYQPLVRQILSH
jgi:hypothetical protein